MKSGNSAGMLRGIIQPGFNVSAARRSAAYNWISSGNRHAIICLPERKLEIFASAFNLDRKCSLPYIPIDF